MFGSGEEAFFYWEKVHVKQLLEVVHVSCPVLKKVDRWVWKVDKLQKISVNSTYGILRDVNEGD